MWAFPAAARVAWLAWVLLAQNARLFAAPSPDALIVAGEFRGRIGADGLYTPAQSRGSQGRASLHLLRRRSILARRCSAGTVKIKLKSGC